VGQRQWTEQGRGVPSLGDWNDEWGIVLVSFYFFLCANLVGLFFIFLSCDDRSIKRQPIVSIVDFLELECKFRVPILRLHSDRPGGRPNGINRLWTRCGRPKEAPDAVTPDIF
jgi:hypothetical protein